MNAKLHKILKDLEEFHELKFDEKEKIYYGKHGTPLVRTKFGFQLATEQNKRYRI